MNRRLTTIIMVALLAATAASFLVYHLVRARASNEVPSTNRIVVAGRDLQIGALVHESDLTYANWVGAVPKGFSLSTKDFVDRGVVAPIYQGEPMAENRLAAVGAGAGLAATIPPGMRACAVKVNDVVGVAGFALPGMRVDVLIDAKAGQASAGPQVKTILQNVMVLSAGQNYHQDAEGKPVDVQVVNLLVTPEQAEMLSLASNETRIQLVLRNPLDSEVSKTTGSDMAELLGESQPKPTAVKVTPVRKPPQVPQPVATAPPPPPPPLKIQVLNGPKHTESTFSEGNQ